MLWVVRMVEERFHRDDEDRPLREGRTPRELLRPGEIEYRTCPYPGGRHLHANPMNASALRQTSAHWDEILDALARLRTAYARARGGWGSTLADLWRVSQLGSALPWAYVLPGCGPAPAYAAALAKATLGVGIWAHRMLARGLAENWTPPPLTPAAIVELAEASSTLIGATEVCAGSERMLLRFFEAMCEGEPAGIGRAAELGDAAAVVELGAHYAAFKVALWIYATARRFLYADVAASDPARAEQARALLAAPGEPPDCFTVAPRELAAVPPARRAAWLARLAALLEPFAPGGGDRTIRDAVTRMAAAAGEAAPPAATYARLDAIFGEVVAAVEAGFRRAAGAPPCTEPIDEAVRDRLLVAPPRALFAR